MKVLKTLLLLVLSLNAFTKSPKITFISPDPKNTKNEFWNIVTSNMIDSAKDLGIDLEIIYTNSHYSFYSNAIKEIAARKEENKPDYLVALFIKTFAVQSLELLEKAKIKTFSINVNISKEERLKVGHPREKYKYWIGHFYPDDYQAAKLVTEEVAKKCKTNKNVISISGSYVSNASTERYNSFVETSKKESLKLLQNFYGAWKKENVKRMMPHIEIRYPNVCGFLVASDWMAEGVIENTKRKYQVCSIDWTSRGLKRVMNKSLLCSVGGHFLEPAFALVAIFDYHNGIDFKDDIGLTYKTPFHVAHKDNAEKIYNKYFLNKRKINFKSYSKYYSKTKKYNFDIR